MSEIKVDALSTVSGSGSITVSNNLTASGIVGVNGGTGGQVATNFSSASTMGMKINDTNSGNLGGMLGFYSGSGAGTLRANIQNANNAGVHFSVGTGGSIVFTQNGYTAANALDDYEEGDFTPTLTPGGGSYNGLTLVGKYTKIGRLVSVQMRLKIDASGNASGSATVGGLPFASVGSWNRMPNKWRENTATGACGQFVVNQGSTGGFLQNDDGSNIAHTTGREYLINAVYYST